MARYRLSKNKDGTWNIYGFAILGGQVVGRGGLKHVARQDLGAAVQAVQQEVRTNDRLHRSTQGTVGIGEVT